MKLVQKGNYYYPRGVLAGIPDLSAPYYRKYWIGAAIVGAVIAYRFALKSSRSG